MGPQAKNSDHALIELFLDMVAAERGGAQNTLAAYARDLADFSAELGAAGRGIADASTEELRAHLSSLRKRGLAAASVARRLSAIRQLYRFLYAEGRRADDPAAVVEGPKRGRTLPKVLGIAEVDRLLTAARAGIDQPDRPLLERLRAARLACLLEVLYATGLRVSELVALPVSAAERGTRMLTVRGEGGHARLSRAARRGGASPEIEMAVPLVRRSRPPHPPALRPRVEGARRRRRPAPRPSKPARAPPRFRQPSSPQRRRPAGGADAARPCRYLHDADLHPCAGGAAQEPGARLASAGRGMTKPSDMI